MRTGKIVTNEETNDALSIAHHLIIFDKQYGALGFDFIIKDSSIKIWVFAKRTHEEKYFDEFTDAVEFYNSLD